VSESRSLQATLARAMHETVRVNAKDKVERPQDVRNVQRKPQAMCEASPKGRPCGLQMAGPFG
jgi:hypothetical protein